MSKVKDRVNSLEDAVGMNWSDMKKIETKISRAMTEMAIKISNIDLQLKSKQAQLDLAAKSIGLNKQAIIMIKNEREAEKELREVDLGNELTGSDLCRAMLERGDKWVLCLVANNPKNIDLDQEPDVVISHDENGFYIRDSHYNCALPISIKGELLTASEVGL